MTTAVRRTVTPPPDRPLCRWCAAPIHLVFAANLWAWAHIDSGYSCRGPARAILPTYAEPP